MQTERPILVFPTNYFFHTVYSNWIYALRMTFSFRLSFYIKTFWSLLGKINFPQRKPFTRSGGFSSCDVISFWKDSLFSLFSSLLLFALNASRWKVKGKKMFEFKIRQSSDTCYIPCGRGRYREKLLVLIFNLRFMRECGK